MIRLVVAVEGTERIFTTVVLAKSLSVKELWGYVSYATGRHDIVQIFWIEKYPAYRVETQLDNQEVVSDILRECRANAVEGVTELPVTMRCKGPAPNDNAVKYYRLMICTHGRDQDDDEESSLFIDRIMPYEELKTNGATIFQHVSSLIPGADVSTLRFYKGIGNSIEIEGFNRAHQSEFTAIHAFETNVQLNKDVRIRFLPVVQLFVINPVEVALQENHALRESHPRGMGRGRGRALAN